LGCLRFSSSGFAIANRSVLSSTQLPTNKSANSEIELYPGFNTSVNENYKCVWQEILYSRLLYNNYMALQSQDLPSTKLDEYRKTAIHRQKLRISRVKARREQAWKLAKKAAKLLRSQFQAERVAVFGSLLSEARFTPWSDIDIAAWGIPSDQTFRAIGAVLDLDSSIEINLVDINTCSPALLEAIEKEAVDL
jgi:uncharacterized protein